MSYYTIPSSRRVYSDKNNFVVISRSGALRSFSASNMNVVCFVTKLSLIVTLVAMTTACDPEDCRTFHFNGNNDDEMIRKLSDFLTEVMEDCESVQAATTLTMEPTERELGAPTTSAISTPSFESNPIDSTPARASSTASPAATDAHTTTALAPATTTAKKFTSKCQETRNATATAPWGWIKSRDRYYHCFNNNKATYSGAADHCKSYGGRLAAEVLRDPAVVSYIASNCFRPKSTSSRKPWIGYDEMAKHGEWVWSDCGETNNATTQWTPGEPNNYMGDEYCANIWGVSPDKKKLNINDSRCYKTYSYICEI